MHNMVFGHVWMLYALTFCLALAFALAGFYALSASGDIRRFPLTRTAIIVIIVLYSLRALAGGWACLAELCLPLLLADAMTVSFWVLYVIAGTTDMLDGFLARRWGVESKFGARLDSLADFVLVLAVGYKLFPWLKLPTTLWMMIGLVALVKIVNAISSYLVRQRIEFLHTIVDNCMFRPLRSYTGRTFDT